MKPALRLTPPAPPSPSIAGRAVRGSLWAAVGAYGTFLVNFAAIATLARFIGPEEFGAYSLALAYNETLVAFGMLPFGQAVVQLRTLPAIADTALRMGVFVRGTLFLIAIPVSYAVARHNGPTIGNLFLALSAVYFADGIRGSMAAVLERELRFRSVSIATFAAVVFAAGLSLWAAARGLGAYALLVRDGAVAAGVLATYVAMGRRWGLPTGRRFDRDTAGRVFRFTRNLFWIRSLEQVTTRLDRVMLGNALGVETLGHFHQAKYLAMLPQNALAPANMQVAIATYSKVREDPAKLARAFDMVQYVVLRIVPLGGISLALFAEEILVTLYGARWAAAAPAVRVLGVFAMLGPVLESYRSFSIALQEWATLRRAVVVQGVVLVSALAILAPRYGAVGAAWATCLVPVAGLAVLGPKVARRVAEAGHGRVWPVMVALLVAAAAGYGAATLGGAPGPATLLRNVALTAAAYALALLLLERRTILARAAYLRDHALR